VDSKIETVQAVYEAFGRGDLDTILGLVTDDVDWASEPDSTIAPWHGIRHGKAELPSFFATLADSLEVLEFTPQAFASSETDVMAVIRFGAKARATGRSATMDLHHWWRFRDGKICFYRGTEHTAVTAELLAT
jgi:ketosteroid isomerase-like protein